MKKDYIRELKEEFFSNSNFNDCEKCQQSIKNPKYKELVFGYIYNHGTIKKMYVYDKLVNERYQF